MGMTWNFFLPQRGTNSKTTHFTCHIFFSLIPLFSNFFFLRIKLKNWKFVFQFSCALYTVHCTTTTTTTTTILRLQTNSQSKKSNWRLLSEKSQNDIRYDNKVNLIMEVQNYDCHLRRWFIYHFLKPLARKSFQVCHYHSS